MVVPWIACASGSEDQSLHQAPTVEPRQHKPMILHERHGSITSSYNWSGYAVTGAGVVSDVKGSWIVPTIQQGACQPSGTQYSSFWVGIDGYSSNTVEQIGTDSDCQNGKPVYYAWYEFYPKFPYNINTITVQAGDVISAEVSYGTDGKFTVSITDESTNPPQSFSISQKIPNAKRSSAEWIIEDSGGLLPDFGIVDFGSKYTGVSTGVPPTPTCWATVGGTSGAVGSFPASSVFEITLVTSDGKNTVMSQPSALSSDSASFTDSFTDTWYNAGP
jgi:hypothetical protein